ncbi:uncharacterized protein FA14DRAFT_185861 [Meira miltonrushii]|uniref:Dickkopf N-terminal cysteine-rich domain-containing protein n=1 Tax=Meira miltonrushii TaxID=1280837 RepID=A0A316V3P3_9BASI|nr:uncharacterized protein FA14DRAFT_185861 [Meira miltonrushii]PWN31874.1 hypothetical protein FA14DRAFT_185861 [Meira miltonrushii]
MVTIRSFAFVLLALSTASLSLAIPERPYAPDLYNRDSLDENSNIIKRSSPSDSAKPYSPDLYFRSALDDQSAFPTKSAPQSFTTQINKRSPSVCKRDSDCGGAHFCSSGSCFMRKAKRALCGRDAMCTSGFCGSQGACLERRSIGSSCADSTNACADGLFCSGIDKKCKQKRGIEEACRFSEGCQEGLSCLNYKCAKSLVSRTLSSDDEDGDDQEDFISALQHKLDDLKEDGQDFIKKWKATPSGSPDQPIWFGKRSSPSGSPDKPIWFGKRSSPSGHHHDPITLQENANEPSHPAPSL